MACGERITIPYAQSPHGGFPLQLDVYASVPRPNPNDPRSTFSPNNRLPFILFLHGGHFLTGSRRDVPPWIASMARDLGIPLLCADYRLAPHAGPSHAWSDVAALWRFIAEELNWVIACSGNGADIETGTEPLDEGFNELQRRGGVDVSKGIIVGLGAGGYLAAMGGALLSPPPLALILGYPILEIDANAHSRRLPPNFPNRLTRLLHPENVGNASIAKTDVPDVPMLLERSPYAHEVRARAGMDMREPWKGLPDSIHRSGLVGMLIEEKLYDSLLRNASPDLIEPAQLLQYDQEPNESHNLVTQPNRHRNRPYPPTLIYHGMNDNRVLPGSSQRFLEAIKRAEPVASALDAISECENFSRGPVSALDEHISSPSEPKKGSTVIQASSPLRSIPHYPNYTARYLFIGIEGPNAGHGFDALLPRSLSTTATSMGAPSIKGSKVISDRYNASLSHVETFIKHWMHEGSAAKAAQQQLRSRTDQNDRKPLLTHEAKNGMRDTDYDSEPLHRGARVKVPLRGPRL